MNRRLASVILCLPLALPGIAHAADAMTKAISIMPAEAMGFVCVPNLKQLDADYQHAVTTLGLQMFVQPPMNSLVTMLKQQLPLLEGMDESGPLAMIFMPVESLAEMSNAQVVLLTAEDPQVIIQAMQGQPGDEGIWSVVLMNQPGFAAVKGHHLIVASSAELAKKVKNSEGRLDRKLKPEELKALDGLDVAIWFGGEQVSNLVKPMAQGFLFPMMMAQAAGGGIQAKSAEMNKKNIEMLLDGAASIGTGLDLSDAGLALRFLMTAKPGTEFAGRLKVQNTSGSLLKGLPAGAYMMAFGQLMDPAAAKASVDNLDTLFGVFDEVKGIEKEKVGELKNLVKEWAPMSTGFRMSMESLSPETQGLFGASFIIDTTNSAQWLAHTTKAFDLVKELVAQAARAQSAGEDAGETEPEMDEDVQRILEALTLTSAAEEVGAVKVQHLKFDFSKIEEAEEEWIENLHKILGKDGALLRMAAVDSTKIVMTFGGGKEYLVRLLENVRADQAPLSDTAGIKKVAAALPQERASVIYIAVDEIIGFIKKVMTAVDEEVIPIQMPAIQAPLAISSSGGDAWLRGDVFFPMDLITAAKDVGFNMMGAMMAAPGGTPPAEPEEIPPSQP